MVLLLVLSSGCGSCHDCVFNLIRVFSSEYPYEKFTDEIDVDN